MSRMKSKIEMSNPSQLVSFITGFIQGQPQPSDGSAPSSISSSSESEVPDAQKVVGVKRAACNQGDVERFKDRTAMMRRKIDEVSEQNTTLLKTVVEAVSGSHFAVLRRALSERQFGINEKRSSQTQDRTGKKGLVEP
jgi:hypothetical protein